MSEEPQGRKQEVHGAAEERGTSTELIIAAPVKGG